MGDVGLLLSLPTESIAVRVAVASVAAVVLVRLLAQAPLVRTRRARAALALVPAVAVLAVFALYAGTPQLPLVWHSVDTAGGLTVPVGNTYLSFAPAPLPLILGTWAAVTAVLVALRLLRHARATRELRARADAGAAPDARTRRVVDRLSAALRVRQPEVRVVPRLPGGGAVVGLRSPVLLLDAGLLAALDDDELAGVVAHELAHVRRRDNLVALGLCLLRDATFFVPGGGWSVELLLREREHAADVVAADVTGRPGALAGGLLKVLESRTAGARPAACAPLLSEGGLVARVEELVDARPAPGLARRSADTGAVAGAALLAVVAAATLPSLAAGPAHERDALGILLSDIEAVPTSTPDRPVVFRSFDGGDGAVTTSVPVAPIAGKDNDLLDPGSLDEAGSTGYRACELRVGPCEETTPVVPIASQGVIHVQAGTDWRLETIVRSESEERALFWLSRPGAG